MSETKKDSPKRVKYLRKNYWVDTRLQLSIVGLVLVLGLFNAASMYLVHALLVSNLMSDVHLVDPTSRRFLIEVITAQSQTTLNTILGISVLSVSVMTIGGIMISHGIAGPAYAIRKKVRALLRGEDEGRIRLRRHDFLGELAVEVNELMDVARGKKKPFASQKSDAEKEAASATESRSE